MSQSPFPSASDEPLAEVEGEPTGRRRTVVVAGALGAVVLGAGAFFLLGGGSADPEQELAAPGQAPTATAPAPGASPAALPAVSKVELGRNPFKALYVQPAAAAAAPVTAPATTAPAAPSTGTVSQPPAPTTGTVAPPPPPPPPPAPAPTSGTGEQSPPPGHLHELQLAGVSGTGDAQTAVFSIDGKQYRAKIGDTFGPTKHLLLISLQQGPGDDDWTAVVQVGDGDPFDVAFGDPVFVP